LSKILLFYITKKHGNINDSETNSSQRPACASTAQIQKLSAFLEIKYCKIQKIQFWHSENKGKKGWKGKDNLIKTWIVQD
jgi:hypothetical protein